MKVTIKMNHSAINQLKNAALKSVEMTAEAVKTDIVTSQVVPKNVGELEKSAFVDTKKLNKKGVARIIYDSPYARRLYWHPEYDFRTDKNPNAQGKWMDSYIDGENKDFARNAFKKLYKQNAKGLIK